MRKAAFLLLIIITYYLAGMYRYFPLMVLCGIEFLLVVAAFFLPRIFRKKLSLSFLKNSVAASSAQAGVGFPCLINVEYSGRLPISRFTFWLRFYYESEKKHTEKLFYGSCREKSCGDMELSFFAPYCGILFIGLDSFRVYDYFVLFSAEKQILQEIQIAVFPKKQELFITLSEHDSGNSAFVEDRISGLSGDAQDEVRQIREYREGDQIRRIHWNQSAKTGNLWIMEYEKETDAAIHLILEPWTDKTAGIEKFSAFYTLTYAMILGLKKNVAAVFVYFQDIEKNIWKNICVENDEDCRQLLLLLYRQQILMIRERSDFKILEFLNHGFPKRSVMRLNLDLQWFAGEDLIFCFSLNNLNREIVQEHFVL